jgi:hypothetical protein
MSPLPRVMVARMIAEYMCSPKSAPSCGTMIPVAKSTCPSCRLGQVRPVASPPMTPPLADCVLVDDDGTPLALCAQVSASAAGFVAAAARRWSPRLDSRARLSGIGDRQAMFGTLAPVPIRQRYGCTRSAIARKTDPEQWAQIAGELHGLLAAHVPAVAEANVKAAAGVADIWKFPGTGWTSGVLNLSQLLPFHRDAGNLTHSWSAMIGARSKVDGGHLYLPEYGVTLAVGHRSLVAFPGGDITHGVTPMVVGRGGWRVTAVFYGLRGCVECEPNESDEIARIGARATERARIMAHEGGPT